MFALVNLPAGATQERTLAVDRQVERHFLGAEKNNVDTLFTVAGFNFSGQGQNLGQGFLRLKDWKYRLGKPTTRPPRSSSGPTSTSRPCVMGRCSSWFPQRCASLANPPGSTSSSRTRGASATKR